MSVAKLKKAKLYLEYKRLCRKNIWFDEATPISAEKLIELFQLMEKQDYSSYFLRQKNTLDKMKKVIFHVEKMVFKNEMWEQEIVCRYSLTSFDDYLAIQEYLHDKWQKEQAQLKLKEECKKRARRVKFEEYLKELKKERETNG